MTHLAFLFTLLAQVQLPTVQVPPVSVPPITQPAPQQPSTQIQASTQTDLSASMQPYRATLVAVSGTTAQVQFADGSMKNFTVDSDTGVALGTNVGKPVAFRVVQGSLQLAKDVKWAMVQTVKNGVATLRDAASKATSTVNVTSTTQAQAQANVGKTIAYTVGANNTLILVSEVPPTTPQ